MDQEGYTDDPGWFVDTRLGRVLLSGLAAACVYFLVVWNLPDSEIRDQLRPPLAPTVRAAGIGQDWGVFAPNPVSTSYRVEADVTFDDGTVERYQFPDGDPWVGAYREFRWRKYESRVRRDENRRRWKPTAEWIRRQYADDVVVGVDLIRLSRPVPEPGTGEQTEWTEESFYELRFPAQGAASKDEASP
ncbi:MAG: hypothetical protein HKN24_07490 [Acidimicrobiales bacterium]|nr:hypothetical protein [Acidimicrobiales bacterium]